MKAPWDHALPRFTMGPAFSPTMLAAGRAISAVISLKMICWKPLSNCPITCSTNVNMFMAEDYTGSKTCQKDDLVFNIMWTWMGALGVSDRSGIVSSSYGIFRQQKEGQFNSKYIEYLLKTTGYIEHYNKISTGLHSSRLRFYGHMFFNMELGFPDKKEQDQIVSHIQTQSIKIDKAIAIQEQMIVRLKEYKSTLP